MFGLTIPALLLNNWKLIGIGILAALLGIQTMRISSLKSDVEACEARNLAQVSDWRAKYAEAVTQATQAKAATEAASEKVTANANDTSGSNRAAFNDAVRVRRASPANPGSGGKANLPSLPIAASIFDGPDPDTRISKDDAGLCGDITLRLIDAKDWALEQKRIRHDVQ